MQKTYLRLLDFMDMTLWATFKFIFEPQGTQEMKQHFPKPIKCMPSNAKKPDYHELEGLISLHINNQ